ncbi:pentapeptide repeat-containing protein [Paenibacillus glycanilyticus]|uniref:pentapeptide repeat-containing protein n=1 Tax=Paenibacillus glycanilyticus TaxID=126569 RepID=UPI0020407E9D|nr:pentapeptide repeat-containing protein [Paenibacillus glycanilyticus]MCM3628666.1 pentapeptide repeat-containing protein [Paenibacillus glycanilyticus]
MSLTIGPYDLQNADISGAKWQEVRAEELNMDNVSIARTSINNVNMNAMKLNDVNMSEIQISDANMSGLRIKLANFSHANVEHVYLFGTEFKNIVLPREDQPQYQPDGQYRPIRFDDCNLSRTQLTNCDLSNVDINNCDITGLRINGILISDLLKAL